MAHMLDMTRGKGMAYVGETPWHGLGTLLTEDADFDQWRIAAGLDYRVEKRQLSYPVYDEYMNERPKIAENTFALVRDDTQERLGTCSDRYQILQPEQALQFIYDLCSEAGVRMETAGALMGGKKIWALADMGESFRIKGQDELRNYMMISTGFDGFTSSLFGETAIRVVCANTMQYALDRDGSDMVTVPHSTAFDPEKAREILANGQKKWAVFEEQANHLAEVKVSDAMMIEFVRRLLGPTAVNVKDDQLKVTPTAQGILHAAATSPGHELRSSHGTLWGLYQGVTNFYDYNVRAQSEDSRRNRAWFGTGNTAKNQALRVALSLAEIAEAA